jgi:hypothetical protein
MCSVSAIVSEWTNPQSPNYFYRPNTPGIGPSIYPAIQPDTAALMLQIIAKLEELYSKVNAIDCKLAEPEKEAFKKMLQKIASN